MQGIDKENSNSSNSPINCNDNEVNVIDPLLSQSSYIPNASTFNPQTPIPPFSPFLNYTNHTTPTNQFQMNYSFKPINFTPHPQQQYSFQGLMNAPHLSFESQTLTSLKNKGRKQKSTPTYQTTKPVRRNWTNEEDVALTKAWLHISIDPLVGKDQKSETMWLRVAESWKVFLKDDFVEDRPIKGLKKRWGTIQGAVNKFNGIYEQLERSPKSGTNADDWKRHTYKVYKETSEGSPFLFEQCWVECKKNAKWCTLQLTTMSSKRKKSNDGNPSLNSNDGTSVEINDDRIDLDTLGEEVTDQDDVVRPPGRNTSKEKKKMQRQDKGMIEVLSKMQVSLEQQFKNNQEELELRRENTIMMKEYELREHAMKKELEFKEKEFALKEKAQRRRDQQKILNQDLSKLSPTTCATMVKMQEKILKEWEDEDFGI